MNQIMVCLNNASQYEILEQACHNNEKQKTIQNCILVFSLLKTRSDSFSYMRDIYSSIYRERIKPKGEICYRYKVKIMNKSCT